MSAIVLLLALRTGTLVVDTPHYGATVSVDRRPIGTAPVDPVQLRIGWHLIEVFARDRPSWSRLVFIAPGKTITLNVKLGAAPPRPTTPTPATPAKPKPRWTLTGRAAGVGALRGRDASLALQQRAHLAGTDVLGASTRVSLALFGESRLAGQGAELLRRIQPRDPSRLRIDEALVGWRTVRAGRLLMTGPASSLLVLDGVAGTLNLGTHQLSARGGLRGAPVGQRPADPVGGLGWRMTQTTTRARLSWLYHVHHHLDAAAQTVVADTRLHARVSTIDLGLHRTDLTARRAGILLGYCARGSARSDLVDPVGGLLARDPRPWHGPRLGLNGARQAWRGSLNAAWRRSPLGDRWHATGDMNRRVTAWNLGVRGSVLASSGPRVGQPTELHHQMRAALTARWLRRLDAHAGLAWQATNVDQVWLPEAGLRVDWPLIGTLSLDAEISVQAVDPAVLPGHGVLSLGRLGIRLR